jgi:hypothetical protein
LRQREFVLKLYVLFNKLMVNFLTVSISSGLLDATKSVNVAMALLLSIAWLSALNSSLFFDGPAQDAQAGF